MPIRPTNANNTNNATISIMPIKYKTKSIFIYLTIHITDRVSINEVLLRFQTSQTPGQRKLHHHVSTTFTENDLVNLYRDTKIYFTLIDIIY